MPAGNRTIRIHNERMRAWIRCQLQKIAQRHERGGQKLRSCPFMNQTGLLDRGGKRQEALPLARVVCHPEFNRVQTDFDIGRDIPSCPFVHGLRPDLLDFTPEFADFPQKPAKFRRSDGYFPSNVLCHETTN